MGKVYPNEATFSVLFLIVPFELGKKTPVQYNGSINVMLDPLHPLLCIFFWELGVGNAVIY